MKLHSEDVCVPGCDGIILPRTPLGSLLLLLSVGGHVPVLFRHLLCRPLLVFKQFPFWKIVEPT